MNSLRQTAPLTGLLLIILIAFACCPPEPETGGPLLILYAFEEEGRLLADSMDITAIDTLLHRAVYSGTLGGREIVLTESGMGMTNAAMTVQKMIDHYHPRAVVFSGIAGAVDTSIKIGDIVVCNHWATHDYGVYGENDLTPHKIQIPGENGPIDKMYFDVDAAMFLAADTLGSLDFDFDSIGNRIPRIIVGGTGVSGNQFIDQVEKRKWLSETFDAQITDMETAAVIQVCHLNGLPFIAFRSASDLAGGSGTSTAGDQIGRFMEVAADNSARVVIKYIELLN